MISLHAHQGSSHNTENTVKVTEITDRLLIFISRTSTASTVMSAGFFHLAADRKKNDQMSLSGCTDGGKISS